MVLGPGYSNQPATLTVNTLLSRIKPLFNLRKITKKGNDDPFQIPVITSASQSNQILVKWFKDAIKTNKHKGSIDEALSLEYQMLIKDLIKKSINPSSVLKKYEEHTLLTIVNKYQRIYLPHRKFYNSKTKIVKDKANSELYLRHRKPNKYPTLIRKHRSRRRRSFLRKRAVILTPKSWTFNKRPVMTNLKTLALLY